MADEKRRASASSGRPFFMPFMQEKKRSSAWTYAFFVYSRYVVVRIGGDSMDSVVPYSRK